MLTVSSVNSAEFPRVMVAMAQIRTLPEVLRSIVQGIATCPEVALARIWLLQPGDLCAQCRFSDICTGQLTVTATVSPATAPEPVSPLPNTRCLHLVASAGHPGTSGGDLSRIDGSFRRFPLGHRKIGRVAATSEPLLLTNVRGDEEWVADPAWIQREKIRTFAAQPLVFRGEMLGVLGIFDRNILSHADFEWLGIFANHAAVSITNANAFDEIAYLKERLEEENTYLREQVSAARGSGDLVGTGAAYQKLWQQIELVAPTEATVLISGESGTGKELVARAIHQRSKRREQVLVSVNCGAVAESLFESEFFGHAKGAFTGALADRPGRFELANGGTLFLDEIGELSLPLQAKLLRVLQEREVERVGENKLRKIDVRILAATNRDLKAEVLAGRFRQDLFYRLSVFPIENPALRERREDIPVLTEFFVQNAAKRLSCRPPKLTRDAVRQLMAHNWPGNVRELQNAVERAVILARGGVLQFDVAQNFAAPVLQVQVPHENDGAARVKTREELRKLERSNIEAALAQCGGKVFGENGAARLLGMKGTTLASRLKALGLPAK